MPINLHFGNNYFAEFHAKIELDFNFEIYCFISYNTWCNAYSFICLFTDDIIIKGQYK